MPVRKPIQTGPRKKVLKRKPSPKRTGKVTDAFVISQYFGFKEVKLPKISKEDAEKAVSIRKKANFVDENLPPVEEQIAHLKEYHSLKDRNEDAAEQEAELIYTEGQSSGSHKKKRKKPEDQTVNLHIIGTPKSIAEAILIKTALSILEEHGHKNVSVKINSVGGKESLMQFNKELNAHYRKHVNKMHGPCRELLKDGPHAVVTCENALCKEIRENAPSSLDFLNDANRNHLKEVIEYLESMGISYEMNKDILGDPSYSTHTVFSIIDKKSGKILATGSRLDELAKRTVYKEGIPSATLSLTLNNPKKVPLSTVPEFKKTKVYLIQIGTEAKQKALEIIDSLRRNKIPVYQSIVQDKLSSQLEKANRLKVPYIIIIGQKESKDNTVTIRDTRTHSQITIPASDLVSFIKKAK